MFKVLNDRLLIVIFLGLSVLLNLSACDSNKSEEEVGVSFDRQLVVETEKELLTRRSGGTAALPYCE